MYRDYVRLFKQSFLADQHGTMLGGLILRCISVNFQSRWRPSRSTQDSRAAVRSFARSWTLELKNRKIRVNAVSPGPIATPMLSSAGTGLSEEQVEEFKKNLLNNIPLGRIGHPDEIAKAVAFLASDDSSYITGIELFVDGGVAQI
jgi:NAD(P)-dependent dehydrogenase (short-subunit alcohol dehydrogenase family)